MLVKIMGGRGTGGGSGPINYLLGENRDRDGARLLRGHPDRTAILIDSLEFRQKYVSGVLSFEESNIPEDQKQQIMDSFQQALLPNMSERTNWLWVEHTDKNRLELNFVIPTVDLETGKRVQPYHHRSDLNRVDAWKSLTNDVYRFTDPNDPAKQQTLTLRTNEAADRKSFKTAIDDFTSKLFAAGHINNRDELISAIEKQGLTATRKTKTSTTFTHENGQKFRMIGAFYGENFRSRTAIQAADRGRNREADTDRDSRISENAERLSRAIGHKLFDTERRYFQPPKTDQQNTTEQREKNGRAPRPQSPEAKRDAQRQRVAELSSSVSVDANGGRVDIFCPRLGLSEPIPEPSNRELWEPERVRSGDAYERKWHVRESQNQNQPEPLDDRIRENVIRCSAETDATIQRFRAAGGERVKEYKASDEQGDRETKRAIERIRETGQRHGRVSATVAGRARALADRAGENNRAIEQNNHRHQQLLESVRERLAEQKRANRPTVSRGYRR